MAAAQPQRLNLSKTPARKARRDLLPPLDWAAGHGPVSGALSASTGAGALSLVGTLAHMPPGWPLAIGAAGALGHGIGNSIRRRLTARSLVTRSASWLLAGGWTSWAIASGPLSWTAMGTLAAVGVGIGAMASSAALHEEAAEEERLMVERQNAPERNLDKRREQIARDWEDRIRRVTGVTVTIVAVEFWPTGAGFSLGAVLAQTGGAVTWQRVQAGAKALAGDARLPLGCAIAVEEGHQQGTVVLDIPTENVMGGSYDYPDDFSPLTINGGLPWGMLANSDPVHVLLREACALILGPPGSGKTTFLDSVLISFARSVDTLTWVIDLNAGSAGLPWVAPWLEVQGRIEPDPTTPAPENIRPGVDWLASTPEEALRMIEAAIAINAARKVQYQQLMRRKNTTLLPVTPDLPQIMIVVDEGAELLSAPNSAHPDIRALKAGLLKVMRTTRAMAIRLVLTAVDGNLSALGDSQVRKFSPVGVALTSGESSGNNLNKLFPGSRVDTSQLNAKGCGVIGSATANGFPPVGFKGWKTTPNLVRRAVLATNDRRPTLDQISAKAAGTAYTERWSDERAGWLWDDGDGDGAEPSVYLAKPQQPTQRPGLNLSAFRTEQQAEPGEDVDALAARFMEEIDREFGTTTEPGTEPAKPDLSRGLNLSALRGGGEGPDWLPEAIDAIRAAGPAGMKASAVADMVGRDRKTVRLALQNAAAKGELIYRENGPHSVFIHPDHA